MNLHRSHLFRGWKKRGRSDKKWGGKKGEEGIGVAGRATVKEKRKNDKKRIKTQVKTGKITRTDQ